MGSRWRRRRGPVLRIVGAGLAMAVLATCSAEADTHAKAVGEPLGAPPTTSPATTTSVPDLPFPPVRTDLEPPEVPDPFDLLDEALDPLAGFDSVDEEPTELLDVVEFRLSSLLDSWARASMWDHIEVDGERVLILAMYPYAELRGHPLISEEMATTIAGEDGEVEEIALENIWEPFPAHHTLVGDDWWYTFADVSTAFVAVGDEEAVETAMRPLVDASLRSVPWGVGDCLYVAPEDGYALPYAPFGDDVVVPCEGPHSHYVLATRTFTGDSESVFVSDQDFASFDWLCGTRYEEHVGLPHTESAVDLEINVPDTDEWARGARYGACIIGRWSEGEPVLVDDTYRDAGESVRLSRSAGDCYGEFGANAPPVDCAQPHDSEYLGTIEYESDDYPLSWFGNLRVNALCRQLFERRAADTESDDGTIEFFALPVPQHHWEEGDRTVPCFAYPLPPDPESGEVAVLVGPLTGEWRIVPLDDIDDA